MITSHSSPIVSVILPTYNRATMVTRAIESVLGQEFADLELIVIDDGSTDQTPRLVSKIEDKRLRYIYLERNRGNSAARNEGIRQARGEFIAQIDSDDLWLSQKIPHQYDILQKYKHLDLIFCNYMDLDDRRGTRTDNLTQNERAFQRLQVQELGGDAWEILGGLPEALLISTFILQSSVILRRSTMESVGWYNEGLRGGEDFEYWWRAALKGAKFAYTSRILVERHRHGNNLTADKLVVNALHLQALQDCDQLAVEVGRTDLFPHLRKAKFATWCRIIFEYSYRAEFRHAITAYKHSLEYGSPFDLLFYISKVTLRRGKEQAGKFYQRMKKEPG